MPNPQVPIDSLFDVGFDPTMPDDKVLHCALYFRMCVAPATMGQVLLLSNDKNLCIKAMIHGIYALEKRSFPSSADHIHMAYITASQLPVENVQSAKLESPDLATPVHPQKQSSSDTADETKTVHPFYAIREFCLCSAVPQLHYKHATGEAPVLASEESSPTIGETGETEDVVPMDYDD